MKVGMFVILHYILGLQLTIIIILKLIFFQTKIFLAMWGKVSFSVILSADKQAHSQCR